MKPTVTTLHAHATQPLTASVAERTIEGVICEYGALGYTSAGATIFDAGSLVLPAPLARAKLLVQHAAEAAAVGVMSEFIDDARLPRSRFTIPAGAEGDDALVKAASGLRDGLSVGVHIDESNYDRDNVLHVVKGRVYEVSLVTVPAFENAGVTSVAAAHQEKETPMNREQLAAALEAGDITQEDYDTQLAALDAADPAAAPEVATAASSQPDLRAERQAAPPIATASRNDVTLRVIAQRTIEHLKAHGPTGLTAALEHTVPSGDTGKAFLGNKKWVDEVWQVGKVRRPLIETIGAGTLSEDGLEGYAWDPSKLPTVPVYAGSKADVHSEALGWIPKSVAPERFAGAWNIDRKFVDLGRTGMIEKAYVKATEDYKRKTEKYVRDAMVAAATNDGAKASILALLAFLGETAQGGVDGATSFDLDFVHLAPALYAEFIALPEASVPWWLKAQGSINLGTSSGEAGGIKFVSNPALATRAWLAGDSEAVTYEEFDPPVKAVAENIPQGGIDLGVFGYAAVLVNDARGLRKGTVTAP